MIGHKTASPGGNTSEWRQIDVDRGPIAGQRTNAICRCCVLFPPRLEILCPSRAARRTAISHRSPGNRNLAQLFARVTPAKYSRAFPERSHFRPFVRALSALPRQIWLFSSALLAERFGERGRVPDAKRQGR